MNIRIHRYSNPRWGRNHYPFFLRFDAFLKQHFEVEVVDYNIDGNTFGGKIKTQSTISSFGNEPTISDVEYVIENLHTKEIKVLSFTEFYIHYVNHFAISPSTSKVLLAHFSWHSLYDWFKRENRLDCIGKVHPWFFPLYSDFDYQEHRIKRDKIDTKVDGLFWKGSGVDTYRKGITDMQSLGIMQDISPVEFSDYLNQACASKLGLSYYMDLNYYGNTFEYPGELCYRDIEYQALGLPYIRIEYRDTTHDPLLPNVHYVSIPREEAFVAFEKEGNLGVAKIIAKKYEQVKNDREFLSFISNNQRKWFDKNGPMEILLNKTYSLLELEKWKTQQ